MKCSIPGSNVKVFVRAIHCLGKIGDELHFVPLPEGLALRTVNSSRSAFASFLFAPSFFLQYKDGPGQEKGPDGKEAEEEDSRCKVPMRSILSVFRSPASVEKNVERCKVAVDLTQARLIFTLHCRHGIIKTHSLAIIECETLQAIFSKDSCANQLCAAPKVLCDAVVNFQNNLEEVTMIAHEEKFILKNFVEDETDPAKVVHTQLSLVPREFDVYKIGEDSAITFCLKEFRAILSFAELTALPLQVHFDKAGSPVVFTIDTDTTFNASFVLATLSEPEEVPPGARVAPPSVGTGHPTGKQTSGRGKSRQNAGSKGKNANGHAVHRNANCKGLKRGGRGPAQEEDLEEEEEEVIDITTDMTTVLPRRSSSHQGSKNGHLPRSPSSPQPSTSAQEAGSPVFPTRTARNRGAGSNGEHPTSPPPLDERPESPVFMPRQCSTQAAGNASVMADVEENASNDRSVRMELQPDSDVSNDNNDECVPGTPPSKKFRSLFFGSQTSSMMSQTQRQPVVLAPDTDDEDQV